MGPSSRACASSSGEPIHRSCAPSLSLALCARAPSPPCDDTRTTGFTRRTARRSSCLSTWDSRPPRWRRAAVVAAVVVAVVAVVVVVVVVVHFLFVS